MVYVLAYYKCKCGKGVKFQLDVIHLFSGISKCVIEICPWCDHKNEISVNTTLQVLINVKTGNPAVFETVTKEMWDDHYRNKK